MNAPSPQLYSRENTNNIKKDMKVAEDHFRAGLQANPTAIESHFHLAELYTKDGDENAAINVTTFFSVLPLTHVVLGTGNCRRPC